MLTGKNSILISDLDRQTVLDLIQWLKTNRPDLLEKARNPKAFTEDVAHTKKINIPLEILNQIRVDPDSLHGQYRVTSELKKSAKATATVITASNWIDTAGNFPIFLFAFKSLTLIPSIGISLLLSIPVLLSANAISTAVTHGHRGRWKLALTALILGLIPLNILQTIATGIGMEVLNNQSELAQMAAGKAVDNVLQVKEVTLTDKKKNVPNDLKICSQERQSLEEMPRNTPIEEKAFQSRYVRIYGTFKSQSQPTMLPIEQLPLCVRANRLEAEYNDEVQNLTNNISLIKIDRAELGNDLEFLKKIAPVKYQKTFMEVVPWLGDTKIELRSGLQLVSLGTESFFSKLEQGQWKQLGMNLFFLGISAITSAVSIGMGLTFALSEDAQKSYNREEKEKVDHFLKRMRITLSQIHNEQVQELESSQKLERSEIDEEKQDEYSQYN